MRLAIFACLLVTTACATSPGRLEQNRFQHTTYPYALFYGPGAGAAYPLGPHYTLANFYSPDGRHRHPHLGGEFSVDRTYRDESPAVVGSESFYDLLFTRDDPKARFWVRSVPLPKADADAPLPDLVRRYLDTVAKTGRAAAPFGVEADAPVRPVGVRNLRTSVCELSKREALRADFELENPSAKRTLDEPEWRSVSVVLVRTRYFARVHYPVVMLVGREGGAAEDATLTRDFDRLLSSLALGDKGQGLTMKGGHTCSGEASAPASNAASPSQESGSGGEQAPVLEVPIIQDEAPPEAAP